LESGGTKPLEGWGVDSEYGELTDVLLGPPHNYQWLPSNAVASRAMRKGFEFNKDTILKQHADMCAVYVAAGAKVHSLEPEAYFPYQVYARDSSVMTPWGPIVTAMSNRWRRGEHGPVLRFYESKGIPIYDIVTAGTLEGGDFVVVKPGLMMCGYSGDRTQKEAVDQVKGWVEKEGWELFAYEFDPFFLHTDVFFTMLAPGLAAVCKDAVEPDFLDWLQSHQIRTIDIPFKDAMHEMGCNVVSLGRERVVLPKQESRLKDACKAEGLQIFEVDISMIANGGGSLHCMCQPLRRLPA